MSRPRRIFPPPLEKRIRPQGPAWAMRAIIVVAALMVVAALVITIVTGTLFTAPGSP